MAGGSSSTVWEILAAIGAITGVPSLGWQVYIWSASGPRVRVEIANAFPVYGSTMGEHCFSVKAINDGRAPAVIQGWGLRAPNGQDLVVINPLPFSEKLPSTLDPGSSTTYFIEASDVSKMCKELNVAVADMAPWVRLATGKEIFGKRLPYKV
jgi:hypothetical protein